MRIAYFVSQYPRTDEPDGYFWGGTGAVAAGLAESISRLGHEVTVFTTSPDRHKTRRIQNGVTVQESPSWGMISQAKIAPQLLWKGLGSDFDLLHAHAGNPPAPFGALLQHLIKRTPLAVTYHGDPQDSYGGRLRRLSVRLYKGTPLELLLNEADILFVPSRHYVQESFILGKLHRPIEELPNGITPSDASPKKSKRAARAKLSLSKDAKIILFFGALSPYKGPDVLVESVKRLAREVDDLEVIIAGTGPMLETLRRRCEVLGVSQRTRFPGYIPESSKALYFAAADVFVLPSKLTAEVFPVTLLEAFAAGLPVVVSDLRTFRGYVRPAENGMVVPRGDADALANKLISLLGDEGLRRRLSDGAKETIAAYDWASIARKAEARYEELVSGDGYAQRTTVSNRRNPGLTRRGDT